LHSKLFGEEKALLQAWLFVSACAACKCASCVVAEFQFFLCGGEKIKNIVLISVSV